MTRLLAVGPVGDASARLETSGGVEVLVAPADKRALGLARELRPEVALIALGADAAASLELIGHLIEASRPEPLPVLVLVDDPTPEVVARVLEAGGFDVVATAAAAAELSARVQVAARSRHTFEELLVSRQRELLLELAGAVAHRINQPLTSMSVIVETLRAQHERRELGDGRLEDRLRELQRLVERTARIVRKLSQLVHHKTVPYVGDVRILDLGDEDPTDGG